MAYRTPPPEYQAAMRFLGLRGIDPNYNGCPGCDDPLPADKLPGIIERAERLSKQWNLAVHRAIMLCREWGGDLPRSPWLWRRSQSGSAWVRINGRALIVYRYKQNMDLFPRFGKMQLREGWYSWLASATDDSRTEFSNEQYLTEAEAIDAVMSLHLH